MNPSGLSQFTLILTENCNFNCSYCNQRRSDQNLEPGQIKKALDFFSPWLGNDCRINFYGGEPLMRFEVIREAVEWIKTRNKKKSKGVSFGISTNGSLINTDILEFLDENSFSVLLSYDGLAQDLGRKKNSQEPITRILKRLLKKENIELQVNSVFTPATVRLLSDSIRHIQDLGIKEHHISLASNFRWRAGALRIYKKQLQDVRPFLKDQFLDTNEIPLPEYWKEGGFGLFHCTAGQDRFALAADGRLWGCHLFASHFQGREQNPDFQKYCFGYLDDFIRNHEKSAESIGKKHSVLSQEQFSAENRDCLFCPYLKDCRVCPVAAANSGPIDGHIPGWMCRSRRILICEKKKFWEELETPLARHKIGVYRGSTL